MKLDQSKIADILYGHQLGYSSRKIAEVLGISKSSVNNYLSKGLEKTDINSETLPVKQDGPRILVYDLETAPALAYTFGRWKQNIGQDNIVQEGGWIICAGFKWLGEDSIEVIYDKADIVTKSDFTVTHHLWKLFQQADAVVAHNNQAFDFKMLQARCLVNDLPPLPAVKVIDTLQMAKKNFRLPSNRLDSIAELLGLGRKVSTGGIKLWIDTLDGDEDALSKMLEYCEHDVELLEQIYYMLQPYGMASNFNASHYFKDEHMHCPSCGSTSVYATGRIAYTDVSAFEEMRCGDCGGIHRKRQPINSKEKRQSMLTGIKI